MPSLRLQHTQVLSNSSCLLCAQLPLPATLFKFTTVETQSFGLQGSGHAFTHVGPVEWSSLSFHLFFLETFAPWWQSSAKKPFKRKAAAIA